MQQFSKTWVALWCLLAFSPANAADVPDTVTATFVSKNPSKFTLRLGDILQPKSPNDTTSNVLPYQDSLDVPLYLDLYIATIPREYVLKSLVQSWTKTGTDLANDQGFRNDVYSALRIRSPETALNDIITAEGLDLVNSKRQATNARDLFDRWINALSIIRYFDIGAKVVTATRIGDIDSSVRFDKDKNNPDFIIDVWEVERDGVRTRMAAMRASWPITVALNFAEKPAARKLFDVSLDPATLPAPGADPQSAGPAELKQTDVSQLTTAFSMLLGGVPIENLAQLAALGLDVVGGFAVTNTGVDGAVGFVVPIHKTKTAPAWDRPLDRLGILGARTVGDHAQWIVGPDYLLGESAHLFLGAGLATQNGKLRSSIAFGMTFSISDLLGNLTGKKPATTTAKPKNVKIAVQSLAQDPSRRSAYSSTLAIAVYYGKGFAPTDVTPLITVGGQEPRQPRDIMPLTFRLVPHDPGTYLHGVRATVDGVMYSTEDADVKDTEKMARLMNATLTEYDPGKGDTPNVPVQSIGNGKGVVLQAGVVYFIELTKPPAKP